MFFVCLLLVVSHNYIVHNKDDGDNYVIKHVTTLFVARLML